MRGLSTFIKEHPIAVGLAFIMHLFLLCFLVVKFDADRDLSGGHIAKPIQSELIIDNQRQEQLAKQAVLEEQERQEQLKLEQQKAEQEAKQEAEKLRLQKETEELEAKIKQQEAELARKAQEEKEREQQEIEQRKLEEQKRKEEEQKKQAELEEQKKVEAQRLEKERLEKEEQERVKKEQEEKERAEREAEAQRLKAEQEAKEKAAREAAEMQAREDALAAELEAEEQRLRDEKRASLLSGYIFAIKQRVTSKWYRQDGLSKQRCRIELIQAPNGTVLDVKSSTSATCVEQMRDSVEKAVYRSDPLPEAPSREVFERNIVITFCTPDIEEELC